MQEETRYKKFKNSHYTCTVCKKYLCKGLLSPSAQAVETSHCSFHSPQRKFKFGGSLPLLRSLSELESAQNLAVSCLTFCSQHLTPHSDSLLQFHSYLDKLLALLPSITFDFSSLSLLFSSVFLFLSPFSLYLSSLSSFLSLLIPYSLCFFFGFGFILSVHLLPLS